MCLENEKKLKWYQCIKWWGYITVYKVVYEHQGVYHSDVRGFRFKSGVNVADKNAKYKYSSIDSDYGFHSFKTLRGAKKWTCGCNTIIKCKIERRWIKTIGVQTVWRCTAYRTSKIVIPSIHDKKAIAG